MIFDGTSDLGVALALQTCAQLVIAYLFSRTRLFLRFMQRTGQPSHEIGCWAVFSFFCILGTWLGLAVDGSIANTRAIGAVLGGILGGPWVGAAVGLTGGLHRWWVGGPTALVCGISTVVEGTIAGLFHLWMVRRGRIETLFRPATVGGVALFTEVVQMCILLMAVKPFSAASHLVEQIAVPMSLADAVGAGLFMSIVLDRRTAFEEQSSRFSARALTIAARAEGALRHGLDTASAEKVARIIQEESGVGTVVVTDREKTLAFAGICFARHVAGRRITSRQTLDVIRHANVVFTDGAAGSYRCSVCHDCPIGTALVVPLVAGDEVVGTIGLYEPNTRLFSSINRTLGEGIARLLSAQLLAGRYEEQKQLLMQSELKLLQAQINPHFLFNALNTLAAVVPKDPERARRLVRDLATFFRKNLKRATEEVTIEDELEHVAAYLEIQKARFDGNLDVLVDIPGEFSGVRLPAFSLQPIVANAIKHGTSQLVGKGEIHIGATRSGGDLLLFVDDNAGLWDEARAERRHRESDPDGSGLGLTIVSTRLRNRFGKRYGVEVSCERDVSTRVALRIPLEAVAA
jgi:two-component system LytT family sensor kinase